MSGEERAYMLQTGVPLTDTERRVATEMHMARLSALGANIAKLEAELRTMRSSHDLEASHIKAVNDDWKDLGPNTTLHISDMERKRILRGMPIFEIEVVYQNPQTITARFIPDETETYSKTNPQ